MSALRAVSRPARSLPAICRQSRLASTNAHDSHHHYEEHNSNVYPKETFFTPFWGRTILLTLGLIAYAKYAPEDLRTGKAQPDGEYEPPYFTRVISQYAPSIDNWVKTNEQHLAQSEEKAKGTLTYQSAKLPPMPMRNKILKFEQVSPHRVPVGELPGLNNDLVIRP